MNTTVSIKEKAAAFFLGIGAGLVGLAVLAAALYQVPSIQNRLSWRLDFAMTYLRAVVDPVQPLAAAAVDDGQEYERLLAKPSPTFSPTPPPTEANRAAPVTEPTATAPPEPTPTQIPARVSLVPPEYEKQDINNCGPATLAMYLRYFGWPGDQSTIDRLVKPKREDRNVNVEELVAYVNTQVAELEVQFRVGGDIDTLRRFLAAGYPVVVEESFLIDETFWPNDDRWAGHYLLVTGYDDQAQEFTVQDSYLGPNMQLSYTTLDERWKTFNRVYIVVYPPGDRATIQTLLGDQWDVEANRRHALETAQMEAEANPEDAFAWFNLGTNLLYFRNYSQAAIAYDRARSIGLPQRMLRYQFGPFFAYFNTNRIDDLLVVTEYALKRTPNSEEALLWRGWAMYRQGNKEEAIKYFQAARDANPEHPDAKYALDFVRDN